jgi:hypothetical protein
MIPTVTNKRPGRVYSASRNEWAHRSILPEIMKGKQNPYKEYFGTSLSWIRDKIENETKTQDVPFAGIFIFRHGQKILLCNA